MLRQLLLLIIAVSLFGQDFSTLARLLQKSPRYLSQKEQIASEALQKRGELFNPNYRVAASIGYARTDDGAKSAEYALGAGFDLSLRDMAPLYLGVERWERVRKLVAIERLKAKLWRLYGNYCIKMEALQAKGELADIYDRITRLVDNGVRLGEFSASESIMAHLAQDSLNLELIALDKEVGTIEARIRSMVPEFDGAFVCEGLRPDFDKLFTPKSSALWELLRLDLDNAKLMHKASKRLQTIGVDIEFSDEIDTKRGMVSFSVPLYLSRADEQRRLARLKSLNSALYALKDLKNSYENDRAALQSYLKLYANSLAKTERAMRFSADTLVEQSKLRFKAGEENVLSMLKAIETKIKILENILQLKLARHNSVADFMEKYAIKVGEVLR